MFNLFKKKNSEKKEIKEYKNSSQIVLSTVQDDNAMSDYVNNAKDMEEDICSTIKNKLLNDKKPMYSFSIEHKSMDYTTLTYRKNDLVRVKWSEETKWIKLPIFDDMVDKYINDDRFIAQSNKKEYMWKSSCTSLNDLDVMYPIIVEAFDLIEAIKPTISLSDQEKEYVQAAAKVLADITNDSENIYLSRTTDRISIMYKGSTACSIDLKPYKKKPWRYLTGRGDTVIETVKNLGVYSGKKKDYPGYIELTDSKDIEQYVSIIKDMYLHFLEHEQIYTKNVELSFYQKIDVN